MFSSSLQLQWNEIYLKIQEVKRFMGLQVHQEDVKKANSLV